MELADGVEFDAVVIGTALPNAILAAALARVDKRVLHIDRSVALHSSLQSTHRTNTPVHRSLFYGSL